MVIVKVLSEAEALHRNLCGICCGVGEFLSFFLSTSSYNLSRASTIGHDP